MEQININIQTENAAFSPDPGYELARIFRALAEKAEQGDLYDGQPVIDVNGNRVGKIKISEGYDEE